MDKISEEIMGAVKESAAPNGATNQPASSDGWDIDSLRLDQSFDQLVGAQQILAVVPVRKPLPQEWFRVHPDPSWRLETTLLQIHEDRESFLVASNLRTELWEEIQPIVLHTAVSRYGMPFLWPIRLPKDGRIDRFMEIDMTAAKAAQTRWIRRYWVPEIKSHKILSADKLTDEPVWPEIGFTELLKIAFRDHYIQDLSDPVVKKLRGEV